MRSDILRHNRYSIARSNIIFWLLFFVVLMLCISGCIALSSICISGDKSLLSKQIYAIIGGLILMLIISYTKTNLEDYAQYIYIGSIILMILVILIGRIAMGAQRWISIGGLNFQPSEIAKIAMIFAISSRIYKADIFEVSKIQFFFKQIAIYIAPPVFLAFIQPSLGSAMIFLLLGFTIMFHGGMNTNIIYFLVLLISASIPIAWKYGIHDYQRKRIMTFLGLLEDKLGSGYNILQSKIAIGSGELLGKGYGLGTQTQLHFLPEIHTDFIFAALAEEWGFAGVIFVLFLYTAYLSLCYIVAQRASNMYFKLIASGIGAFIFLHASINIAMISGMLPVVGMPAPFLSYGRSHMIICLVASGMVMNIARHNLK